MESLANGHFGPLNFWAVKLLGHHNNFGSVQHCIYMYYKVYNSNYYQVGHDLIDYVHCMDASLPEHEALPSSHKICLQIEAVIFICSGEDSTWSIRSCPN